MKYLVELTNAIRELSETIRATSKLSIAQPKLESVRAVLADIASRGKTEQMKVLLAKYGAVKLSEVKPEDYPALLADAEEIANA